MPNFAIRARMQDWAMKYMNEFRGATVGLAEGDVLEIGFGTGLNLAYYASSVKSLAAIDPLDDLHPAVHSRIEEAPFPVEHFRLRADNALPFDANRFDYVVSTYTLCSIPDVQAALGELRRVLKPGGHFVFLEHGLSDRPSTARWQQRLNAFWCSFSEGCNMNRRIDRLVEEGGFEVERLERFLGRGPRILSEMYRGVSRKP